MRRVVIEHPFGADPQRFSLYLRECIRDTLKRGESAMSSVAIYAITGALMDAEPEERRAGIEAGLEWYKVAEACVAYVDHGVSPGMVEGLNRACRHNVPIEYRKLYEEKPK